MVKQNLIMEKMIKHIHCPTDGNTIIFILVSILSTFHTYSDLSNLNVVLLLSIILSFYLMPKLGNLNMLCIISDVII